MKKGNTIERELRGERERERAQRRDRKTINKARKNKGRELNEDKEKQ